MSNDKQLSVSVYASDKPTRVAHIGFRFLYTLIAWFVLGLGIVPGRSFFVSLFLFTVPLFMDYCKFRPTSRTRKVFRWIGIISTGAWLGASIIGLSGIVSVTQLPGLEGLWVTVSKDYIVDGGASWPINGIWYCMAFNALLTGADWVVHETELEQWILSLFRKKYDIQTDQQHVEGTERV